MTNSTHYQALTLQDRFGKRIAARLDSGAADLPYEIAERLRAARTRAVAQRKILVVRRAQADAISGTVLALGGDDAPGFWARIASALPLVALAAGLIAINIVQNENRAQEVAEIDAALLTDDLPPSAYADPGFLQFLKVSRERGQ